MQNGEHIRIGFLLFPGFPMACLTSMIEPLRAANEISGKTVFSWQLISETGEKVRSSAEVWFDPECGLDAAKDVDQIFILSGPTSQFQDPRHFDAQLRKFARHGMTLGAVSGGVFPLARAGLLDGFKTSVHWCYAAAFAAEFPRLETTDNVIMIDGKRITASGAAAAFDLALHLIEARLSAAIATEVACWFQHPLVRNQSVAQRRPSAGAQNTDDMLPKILRKAVTMFAEHIEDPINIADVAAAVGISARQLERQFKAATGQSPLRYYRRMRMEQARQLVLYSNDAIGDIALAFGFGNTTAFNHAYASVFDIRPAADRAKINMFRVKENAAVPAT